ncbi:MAG TPA: hypothetical protein VF773_05860 [Verrucomicrobiae bacterium]
MFGFLKKFGKKSDAVAPLIPVPIAPEPAMASVAESAYAAPAAPQQRTGFARAPLATRSTAMPSTRVSPAVTPRPVRTAVPGAATPPAAPAPVRQPVPAAPPAAARPYIAPAPVAPPVTNDVLVELPLKKLWHKLNPAVIQGAAFHPNGDSFLCMPLSLLQAQLARGQVRISFPEFQSFAPEGLFLDAAGREEMQVDLPIADILPLLGPEHLSRRPQRRAEIPDDIGPIFGPSGGPAHGLRIAETRPRAGAPTAQAPAPAPEPPKPSYIQPAQQNTIPAPFPIPAPKISAPIAPPVASAAPISPIAPAAEQTAPSVPVYDLPPAQTANEPIRAPKLDPSLATLKPKAAAPIQPVAPAPASIPAPIPARVAPAPASNGSDSSHGETFNLALMDIAAFWSEKGRNDLSNLYKHSLEIPMSTLESSLKSGKLAFQWREVRPWLRLAAGNTAPTLQDDLIIEFPLAIIAPRFVEQRFNGKSRRKFELGDDIGDVFEQKTPAPGAPPAPSAPVLGATAVAMDMSAAITASTKTGDTAFVARAAGKTLLEFGEIFGQPDKKDWTMAEVAQKTMTLRGVTGAVISNADGMLVAGSWPNVKGDAVAAFLPQMYNRTIQYTKELKLGEPGNLTLMIDNIPLQIFKAGSSYFTVLGRAGENLPKAQLNAIATRLSTQFSGK